MCWLKIQAVQMGQCVSEVALGLDLLWVQLSVHSVRNQRCGHSHIAVNNAKHAGNFHLCTLKQA